MKSKSPLIIDEAIKDEEIPTPEVTSVEVEKDIQEAPKTNNYIPIHLESEGLLDAPKVLHFRDYSMEDALNLNSLEEDDQLNSMVTVLNSMVWEDFDCAKLHPKELAQIVYTIHGNFINSKIEKDYYYDEDLPEGSEEGQLDHPDNIGTVEIPVNTIKTKNINKHLNGKKMEQKFHEPFSIVDSITKMKFKFRLTRVYDLIFAQKYCTKKYAEILAEYAPFKRELNRVRNIKNKEERDKALDTLIDTDYVVYSNYRKIMEKFSLDFARVTQCSVIVGVDDKEFTTFEEKMDAYKNTISQTLWDTYNDITNNYDFGIIEKVSFYSEKLQKTISRGFLFQFDDFLPNPDKNYSGRYSVRFD